MRLKLLASLVLLVLHLNIAASAKHQNAPHLATASTEAPKVPGTTDTPKEGDAVGPEPPRASISLIVNITSLQENAEYVKVTFESKNGLKAGDAVAYVQDAETADYAKTPPQKFKWVATSKSSKALKTGSGSLIFRVLNTRKPFKFIYVTNVEDWSSGNFTVLASTSPIPIEKPNSPTQVRIALTGTPWEAVISWTTATQTDEPVVMYGVTSQSYTDSMPAAFDSYTRTEMCGGIANSTGWTDPGLPLPLTAPSAGASKYSKL